MIGTAAVTKVTRTTASQGLVLMVTAVTAVLVARGLQPEGRGIYAVVAVTAETAIVAGRLSMEKAHIALWEDGARGRALAANGLVLGPLLGAGSALIIFLLAAVWALPGRPGLLVVALIAVPFGVTADILRNIGATLDRIAEVNRATVGAAAGQLLLVLALTATDLLTLETVILSFIVRCVAPLAVMLPALRPSPRLRDVTLARRQLAIGVRHHLGTIAFYLLLTVDTLLVSAMSTPGETGRYTVAVTVITLALTPALAIRQIALPGLSGPDHHAAGLTTIRAIKGSLLLTAVAGAGIATAAPVLVPLVYGPAYGGSVASILILTPGIVALSLAQVAEQHLVREARPHLLAALCCLTLCADVILTVTLVPDLGGTGAAIAKTGSYLLMATLYLGRLRMFIAQGKGDRLNAC